MNRKKKYSLLPRKHNVGYSALIICIFLAVCILPKLFPELSRYFNLYDPNMPGTLPEGLSVHFIDVGQGDSQLIVTENKCTVLIDTGESTAKDELISYLKYYDISTIDYFIISHPHSDHAANAAAIIKEFDIKNFVMPDAISTSNFFYNAIEAISKEGSNIIVAGSCENKDPSYFAFAPEGKLFFIDPGYGFALDGARFTVLAPLSPSSDELNDASIVLRLDYHGTSFLFTGDAEEESEAEMLKKFDTELLDVDVLKVAHHGSSTSSTKAFLNTVTPEYAVISCGEYNTYGHPHSKILNNLQKLGADIYRTDELGTVIFSTDGRDLAVKYSP